MLTHLRLGLAYVTVLLIWSGTPLAIQWSATEAGLSLAVTARMTLAAIAGLILCALLKSPLPRTVPALKAYGIIGIGFYLAMLGVYWAATRVDSGLMSVLFGLTPIASNLLASLLLGQRLSHPVTLLSMLVAVAGLAVIFADASLIQRPGFLAGAGVALLAMCINAWTLVWLKQHAMAPPPLATTIGSIMVSLPLFALTWLLQGASWPQQLSTKAIGSIVYLAIPGSLLAFVLYYYILKHLKAEQVALILVLTPVLALVWGHLFNHEQWPAQTLIGAILVLLGLVGYLRSLSLKE